ncbi:hypothetical protein QQF64_033760 [Cirrhinus molitorella]|uniref:DUF4371 domain-containing protein n=1 Tax=Cirrhinus molitorella TaxID=172907 RepID=A0ABR3MUU2_9TELE
MVYLLSHEDGEDNEEQVKENDKAGEENSHEGEEYREKANKSRAGEENSHEDEEDNEAMIENEFRAGEVNSCGDEEQREKVNVSSASEENSAGQDGEPHLQNDIGREELDGECRDATEEEAEEKSYPEDPSDWPAPHQITDTFRQNMTERGPLKCPDGPYPRSEASHRRFSKAYYESKKTSVQESCVGFTAVKDTTGQGLAEKLIEVIEKNLGLELINCCGQSYDNGSNMSGIQKGVQALILEKNPEAIFIPCCSHSLNLLLCDAASSNRECLTFFGTLQRLYTIFSSSVKRWDVLKEFVEITLKPLSDTRWEAKLDSVKALRFQLGGALDALEKLEKVAKDGKIASEAKSLSEEVVHMEFLVCLIIWYDIFAEITHVSKALQAPDVSLDTAIMLINSLKDFFVQYREEGFQKSMSIARKMASELNGSTEFKRKRLCKQKKFHDETSNYSEDEDPEVHFRCGVFNVIVDTAIQELSDRLLQFFFCRGFHLDKKTKSVKALTESSFASHLVSLSG